MLNPERSEPVSIYVRKEAHGVKTRSSRQLRNAFLHKGSSSQPFLCYRPQVKKRTSCLPRLSPSPILKGEKRHIWSDSVNEAPLLRLRRPLLPGQQKRGKLNKLGRNGELFITRERYIVVEKARLVYKAALGAKFRPERRHSQHVYNPWACFGVFNECLGQGKKRNPSQFVNDSGRKLLADEMSYFLDRVKVGKGCFPRKPLMRVRSLSFIFFMHIYVDFAGKKGFENKKQDYLDITSTVSMTCILVAFVFLFFLCSFFAEVFPEHGLQYQRRMQHIKMSGGRKLCPWPFFLSLSSPLSLPLSCKFSSCEADSGK